MAATAPFLGMFGNVVGIVNSFRGCGGSRSSCMAALAELLSEAMMPAALGLAVAITALWGFKYLSAQVADLHIEMRTEAGRMPDYLAPCGLQPYRRS